MTYVLEHDGWSRMALEEFAAINLPSFSNITHESAIDLLQLVDVNARPLDSDLACAAGELSSLITNFRIHPSAAVDMITHFMRWTHFLMHQAAKKKANE